MVVGAERNYASASSSCRLVFDHPEFLNDAPAQQLGGSLVADFALREAANLHLVARTLSPRRSLDGSVANTASRL